MENKLSIIIPNLNSNFLLDTLSCFKDLKIVFEIVVVDDFSSTQYKETVYKNLNNIKIIQNSSNKGPHFSRLEGLLKCSGNYVMFVDSDDYIYPQVLNQYLPNLYCNNPDIICFSTNKFAFSSNGFISKSLITKTLYNCSGDFVSLHAKIFSKKILLENLEELKKINTKFGEDFLMLILLCNKADTFITNSNVLYFYRNNENGICLCQPKIQDFCDKLDKYFFMKLFEYRKKFDLNNDVIEKCVVSRIMIVREQFITLCCNNWHILKQKIKNLNFSFFLDINFKKFISKNTYKKYKKLFLFYNFLIHKKLFALYIIYRKYR